MAQPLGGDQNESGNPIEINAGILGLVKSRFPIVLALFSVVYAQFALTTHATEHLHAAAAFAFSADAGADEVIHEYLERAGHVEHAGHMEHSGHFEQDKSACPECVAQLAAQACAHFSSGSGLAPSTGGISVGLLTVPAVAFRLVSSTIRGPPFIS